MEKRAHERVKVIFPVDLETDSALGNSSENKNETIDISEGGLRLVSRYKLPSLVKANINLPPCYSEDPRLAIGIKTKLRVAWSVESKRGKVFSGLRFADIRQKDADLLKGIIAYEVEKAKTKVCDATKPEVEIIREPHSCNMYAVDLTVGCENECKYCHFSMLQQDFWQKKYPNCKDFPIAVDLSPLYKMKKFPETVVYLSPSSDAFAPKARSLTHELLEFLLPKGVIFTVSTKNIIPEKTIKLFKRYHHQIEGIAMGLTNLDDKRNVMLEKGCPTAGERLEHIKQLKEIGCFIGSRMDPLFPLVDDTEENLRRTIKALASAGVGHVTGTYLFTYGKRLRDLGRIPMLKASMAMIKEKTYPMGGAAYSVSLEHKKKTYEKMNELCLAQGIKFNTCGCKDSTLRETGYPLICRNIDYYQGQGVNK